MSEKNRAGYSIEDRVKLFMGLRPQPSKVEELVYKHKCFQSLANLMIKKDTSNCVICLDCISRWYYMIKECPLCRSINPEDSLGEATSTESSGMCDKISGKVVRPIKVTNKCITCFVDVVAEVDDEYEEFLKGCGHVHCERCARKWLHGIHDCLFCGKKITLLHLVENQPGQVGLVYECGRYVSNCCECLRRWAPGDSKCPFCYKTTPCDANKQDEPSSNVGNISENQEEVLKDHEDQNPVSKIAMEDACSSHHEIENPVNTSTNQASTSNTFDSFGNEKQEQVPANKIDQCSIL